jgi:sulfofructose kinase
VTHVTSYDVLCVGAVNHDSIAAVTALPEDDQRIIADDLIVGHGGPAATAAVTLARLGHSVALCSSVGDDPEGASLLESLEAEGVNVRFVHINRATPTAKTLVIVNRARGTRTIITSAYCSTPQDPPLAAAPIVHVDQVGYAPVYERLRTGAASGKVSVDGGNPIPRLDLRGIWLYAPTATVLSRRSGYRGLTDAASRARSEGAKVVVVTDGSRGSWWCDELSSIHAPSVEVDVVSTLGAGDVFHGALLAAIIDGLSPRESLVWANTCAALSCRGLDGRTRIPGRAELKAAVAAAHHAGKPLNAPLSSSGPIRGG